MLFSRKKDGHVYTKQQNALRV